MDDPAPLLCRMLPGARPLRALRLLQALLLHALLVLTAGGSARAQGDGTGSVQGGQREWLRLQAGIYVGGFPLQAEGGVRFGLDLYRSVAVVGVDIGGLVPFAGDATSDRALRAELTPVPIGVGSRLYLHGYRRWIGTGAAFGEGAGWGGGVGMRFPVVPERPAWITGQGFVELSVAFLTSDAEGLPIALPPVVPSILRMGGVLVF